MHKPNAVKSAVDSGLITQPIPTDSISIEAYKADGGYQLYEKLVAGETNGDTIIEALEGTALRGLGGAGFPLGRKWRILRDAPAPRLMAINIDEGEPGTFKDRYYMLTDPHRFLEGMLIASEVIGIDQCYIYVRDEYPSVSENLRLAIEALQRSGYDLPTIELRRGAGAYICGEESAMIESIEGKRGMPRLRPPYVAQVGLFGHPTLEQNCESLFWVRDVIEKGGEWFDSQGRHGRKGLRSFSVSGRVNNPGVHLAPRRHYHERVDRRILWWNARWAYILWLFPGWCLGGYFAGFAERYSTRFRYLAGIRLFHRFCGGYRPV